jgi:hypothetical protein
MRMLPKDRRQLRLSLVAGAGIDLLRLDVIGGLCRTIATLQLPWKTPGS